MMSETQECIELAIWLKRKRILFTHVPNGGLRSGREAAKFQAMGVSRGVPDYLIFDAPEDYCGVALEMKKESGGRTSPVQEKWHRELRQRGWIVLVANGYRTAIEQLEGLGY
jgi:hypothetical protein